VSRKHCVVMKQSIGAYASVVIAGLTVTDKTLRACGSTALPYVNVAMHGGQETVRVPDPVWVLWRRDSLCPCCKSKPDS
jgi:hypothetical protein